MHTSSSQEARADRFVAPLYRHGVGRRVSHEAGGGAGLGLAIAREIMRAHGGDIAAHSEAGLTTFVLTVPAPSAFQTASFADER
ncbi:hypothetical protein H6A15_02475 [Enorma phocaeensis]|nr:hypothetical protein [Enorma phocaeensis]